MERTGSGGPERLDGQDGLDELDELCAAWYQPLTGQLYAMLGDRDRAETAVREAFVRAWAARRRPETEERPEAWVRATAFRLATHGRRGPVRRATTHPGSAPPLPGGPDRAHLELLAALDRVPPDQRRLLVLRHVAGLTPAEVAREVRRPLRRVEPGLSAGVAALAALLPASTDGAPADPAQRLRDFPAARVPVDPPPNEELRRRGRALRRRRRGIGLLAAAMVAAGGVAGTGVVTDRDPAPDGGASPAPRSPARPGESAPRGDPLAAFFADEPPASELVGRGDLPPVDLAAGLPDLTGSGGTLAGPAARLPGADRRLICGSPFFDGRLQPTGRLVAAATGTAYRQLRQVLALASAEEAARQMAYLRGAVGGCGTQLGEVSALGSTRLTWRVFEADTGHDTFTFGAVTDPAAAGQLYQVTRLGRLVLVVSLAGEYLPDSQEGAVPEVTEVSRRLADELCGSPRTGC